MNRKNRILTMLACLNCVHTTHAVEKSAETQIRESLDKLEEQFKLQNLLIQMGKLTGNPNRDAAIQREKILQKVYKKKKDDLLPDNPRRSFYKELIDISHETDEDLKLQSDDSESFLPKNLKARFNKKIRDGVDSGRLNNFIKVSFHVSLHRKNAYVEALGDADPTFPYESTGNVPSLSSALDPANPRTIKDRLTDYDQDIQNLENKYPDIAQQRRGVYRKVWAHELNSSILQNPKYWIGNIAKLDDLEYTSHHYLNHWINDIEKLEKLEELEKSKTAIGRDMLGTIVITLRNNLRGEDKALKAKTIALLEAQDTGTLEQMVFDTPEMLEIYDDLSLEMPPQIWRRLGNGSETRRRGLEIDRELWR